MDHYEVANIYESMLSGDKNGLFKLQSIRVKNHVPRFIESYYNKKVKQYVGGDRIQEEIQPNSDEFLREKDSDKIDNEQIQEQIESVPQIKHDESQYLNAIKKELKMPTNQPKQIPKIHKIQRKLQQTSSYYPKEQKKLQQVDLKAEQNINKQKSAQVMRPKLQKSSTKYLLPKVNKNKEENIPVKLKQKEKEKFEMVKAQSANIQPAKKVISIDQIVVKTPKKPKQKLDFKDIINKNRFQKQLVAKINDEERQIQEQLIKFHINNKAYLEDIYKKYNLQDAHMIKATLSKKKKKSEQPPKEIPVQQSATISKLSPFKRNMSTQKNRCGQLYEEIHNLSSLYNRTYMALKKIQKGRSQLLFQRYLQRYGLEIQEEYEEQVDVVEPLQDGIEKYTHIMAQTRERKWGLQQRQEYESQRTQSLSESRQINKSRFTQMQTKTNQTTTASDNKITFNQDLKRLLFN